MSAATADAPPQAAPEPFVGQDGYGSPPPDAAAQREAYQYWGYLFKSDKTGTSMLKGLLRGLQNVMNAEYERSDNPDLTPTQLAHFYRDLNGNYDPLFLGTPHASIAFIYKSLGCLHSLQPLPHSTAFTEPTVPALKKEGWIMWQTIQLLLGPEEHSGFLMAAVQKWDVKDPSTGEDFPKLLPRECFPLEPDKHMVSWYEGVSERLRNEAEEEEKAEKAEAAEAEDKRIQNRAHREDVVNDSDNEGTLNSHKENALAYFRNPLYRHVDGRPSIVRQGSKRPAMSPRRDSPRTAVMLDKAKHGAATVSHFVRNVASPNLWDGHHSNSKDRHHNSSSSSGHRRDSDRDRSRRSVPDRHMHYPGDPPLDGYENPAPAHPAHISPRYQSSHDQHRRRSQQMDHVPSPSADDEWDSQEDTAQGASARPSPSPRDGHAHYRRQGNAHDPRLRHSQSHEPQSPGEYFPPYPPKNHHRRSSVHDSGYTPDPAPNSASGGAAGGFMPTASPLFASTVARSQSRPRSGLSEVHSQSRPGSDASFHPRPGSDVAHRPQRQDSYGSPSRPPVGRYANGGHRSSRGSDLSGLSSGDGAMNPGGGYDDTTREDGGGGSRRARPKMARFVTPVGGVSGRRYPNESPWR